MWSLLEQFPDHLVVTMWSVLTEFTDLIMLIKMMFARMVMVVVWQMSCEIWMVVMIHPGMMIDMLCAHPYTCQQCHTREPVIHYVVTHKF